MNLLFKQLCLKPQIALYVKWSYFWNTAYFFYILLLRGNSDHSSNGLLHTVVCVRVVHSKISVDVIKYNP